MNITPGISRSLLYVASSRATKAKGLHIVGEFKKSAKPSENDRVMKELLRMRTTCQLIPRYQFLTERDEFDGIQFMYHNVQSLHKHHQDILADPLFGKCNDLILLSETWTIRNDMFQIPGFKVVERIDSDDEIRKAAGVIAYVNENLLDQVQYTLAVPGKKVQIILLYILNNVRFALFYASPQASLDKKLEAIFETLEDDEHCKTVLVGDFNSNFNSPEGEQIIEDLQLMNLDIRTNPIHFTTRGLTTSDAIFSNRPMRTGVYMSTYSYHFPLYGQID